MTIPGICAVLHPCAYKVAEGTEYSRFFLYIALGNRSS